MDAILDLVQKTWERTKQPVAKIDIANMLYDDLHPANWRYALQGLEDAGLVVTMEDVVYPEGVI